MRYRVAIIGAGQLGSRYLQGMVNSKLPLEIIVIDPSKESLIQAQERWNEVDTVDSIHSVEFLKSHKDLNNKLIDIVIVSTNSTGRADLILELSNQMEIRYWIIEKVLAQSVDELNLILDKLQNYPGAWINTPRRMIKWYQEIIASTPNRSPITCTVNGKDWGLACNAIHFLDLVAWCSGEKIISIQTDQLDPQWHKAKRDGYWEIFGTLSAIYSNGSSLTLNSSLDDTAYQVSVKTEGVEWNIQELNGIATRSDGKEFPGKLEHQSEITARLIELILNTGSCELPDLETSVYQHLKLLGALLDDWNLKMSDKRTKLAIT
jgi:hypothetical protein